MLDIIKKYLSYFSETFFFPSIVDTHSLRINAIVPLPMWTSRIEVRIGA